MIKGLLIRQETGAVLIAHDDGLRAVFASAGAAALFGIEMVLARLPGDELAIAGYLQALGI